MQRMNRSYFLIILCFTIAAIFFFWNRFADERKRIESEAAPLVNYQSFGEDAILSVLTPEHFLPFLYVLGLRDEKEQESFPGQGVDGGSVSMLAIQIG